MERTVPDVDPLEVQQFDPGRPVDPGQGRPGARVDGQVRLDTLNAEVAI